jgi:hypothetical protein
LHGAVVVVVVDVVPDDFDLAVVVVEPDPDVAAVVGVAAAVEAVEHGTVVALPAACAMPFASVPPPEAPR